MVVHAGLDGWYAEPVPLCAAAAALLLYARGGRSLAATSPADAPTNRHKAFLVAGLGVLLLALLSPLDELALRLQWAHMVQHVLILVVAAPLVVLSRPWETGLAGLAPGPRRVLDAAARALTASHRRRALSGALAVVSFVGVLWLWHIPTLYDLTLRNDAVHNVEHTSFLVTGLLFWTAALPRPGRSRSLGPVGQSVVVLAGLIGSWLLAVYLGYASAVLFSYAGSAGLSALADQQLAAGVMWVPGSVPFIAALVWIVARWFESDAHAAANEARSRAEAGA